MTDFDNFDKARRIIDNTHDISEIERIISDYKQGLRIDRGKAEDIINRLKLKDAVIALFNSPLNSGWTLFQNATDEQIVGNLNITRLYLSGKMTAEGIQDLVKANRNS